MRPQCDPWPSGSPTHQATRPRSAPLFLMWSNSRLAGARSKDLSKQRCEKGKGKLLHKRQFLLLLKSSKIRTAFHVPWDLVPFCIPGEVCLELIGWGTWVCTIGTERQGCSGRASCIGILISAPKERREQFPYAPTLLHQKKIDAAVLMLGVQPKTLSSAPPRGRGPLLLSICWA